MNDEKLRRARALLELGLTVREAATRLKVGKTVLYAALAPQLAKCGGANVSTRGAGRPH
jgi:transposase